MKYIADLSHVLEAPPIELKQDLLFEVQPMRIVDHGMKELRKKVILMVKVLWQNDTIEDDVGHESVHEESLSVSLLKIVIKCVVL